MTIQGIRESNTIIIIKYAIYVSKLHTFTYVKLKGRINVLYHHVDEVRMHPLDKYLFQQFFNHANMFHQQTTYKEQLIDHFKLY